MLTSGEEHRKETWILSISEARRAEKGQNGHGLRFCEHSNNQGSFSTCVVGCLNLPQMATGIQRLSETCRHRVIKT